MNYRVPFVWVLATPLLAHNYPMSHGVLTVMEGGARLKLRLPTHHFHPALERFLGQRLSPKDAEAYPVAGLERYFAEHLRLEGPEGQQLTFSVVKQELGTRDLVLVLEVLVPSLRGWSLRHRVLMEADSRQVNLVTVEGFGPTRGLNFTRMHSVLAL